MQCPHCLHHTHARWNYSVLRKDKDRSWGTATAICPACERIIVKFGEIEQRTDPKTGTVAILPADEGALKLVYPKAISRSPIPPEVPAELAAEFNEACLVLPDSEKASAALSRRCLQHLLRKKASVRSGDLANEIQQVLNSKQLPEHLAKDLDAIRNVGNMAAHPMTTIHTGEIVDVEAHEAEWLLNVLEGLFDFYFVQPAKAQARRDALNARLASVGKPAIKQP